MRSRAHRTTPSQEKTYFGDEDNEYALDNDEHNEENYEDIL